MKFSRNPVSGIMESYTDDGVFVGNVITMGDLIPSEKTATDGGPGSGNWGHRGRPGKVGGSGRGGGSQYRGGRSDIGYFGSRKDWLNGLSGEPQHEAARFLAKAKTKQKELAQKKEKIESKKDLLTEEEINKYLKESKADKLRNDMTAEEFVMECLGNEDKEELVKHLSEARNWKKNKDHLINENLTDEEKKVLEYGERKFGKVNETLDSEILALKAKAMGINVKPEFSDETLIGAGLKEAPKQKAKYDWYKEVRSHVASGLEGDMGSVMDIPSWGMNWSSGDADRFEEHNKKFLTFVKYERLSPTKCIQSLKAMRDLRSLAGAKRDERLGYWVKQGYTFQKENWDRLSQDEKDRMLELANMFRAKEFKSIEDITSDDYYKVEDGMMSMGLRTKEEQAVIRDYVQMMDKMITGETASETNPVEERKKKEEEEKKKKAEEKAKQQAEFVKQRDAEQETFKNSPAFARKKEALKKARETTSDQINKMSREEVRTFANSIMREGEQFVTHPDIPDEFYKSAALAMKNVIERFPFLAGEIGGFGDNYDGALAGCSIYAGYPKDDGQKGTEIVLRYKDYKDLEALKAKRIQQTAGKWFSQTDEDLPAGYADMVHELGHVLANWLNRRMNNEGFVRKVKKTGSFWERAQVSIDSEISPMLKKNVLKKFGIKMSDYDAIKDELSEYGASSSENKGAGQRKNSSIAEEFFAECFAELMCSSKPRRVAEEFGKQLDKFLKDNNITEDLTATLLATRPKITRV